MQTELNTAKDEKLVDLDTSGEGAEVELEDKSHGAVAPEKYEEVKTEEKDPLNPAVSEQQDEMDQYSDKVKKRIDKLTWKIREAEREKDAALTFAQNVQKELQDARKKTFDIDKGYMSESEVRNKMAADLARQALIAARESGDYSKEEEARAALTKLDLEAERIMMSYEVIGRKGLNCTQIYTLVNQDTSNFIKIFSQNEDSTSSHKPFLRPKMSEIEGFHSSTIKNGLLLSI